MAENNDVQHAQTIWQAIFNKRMLICLFNGFSAGLPLFFLYQLVPAWLRTQEVDLKTIGLFSLVGIPYTWKFIWSPIMDRYTPPFLGRRRGWMLITQIFLLLFMAVVGQFDPQNSIQGIVVICVAIAFFSASQDIVLDAYRRELLPDEELGLGNSFYINGYRAAGFIPGGLGLILAGGDLYFFELDLNWGQVYIIIALFMLIGVAKTLLISEAAKQIEAPKNLREAVVEPFRDFFGRAGKGQALLVLAFLFLYKIGDNMATALSTPFFIDMGFDLEIIGSTVKIINVSALLLGTFVGGAIIFRIGINRSLWVFGIIQAATILGFAVLSIVGDDVFTLGVVLALEYFGAGLGTSALVAYMARATNKNFTATQFALFSSLIALPRTFANATTGFLIEGITPEDGAYYEIFGAFGGLGYTNFFVLCAFLAIPGMVLLLWVAPWNSSETQQSNH